MNLKEEAKRIAEEAFDNAHNVGHAKELITMACNARMRNLPIADALKICTHANTIDSIAYLKKYYGGVSMPGDAFSDIVFRIAWGTLCVAAKTRLDELIEQKEPNE